MSRRFSSGRFLAGGVLTGLVCAALAPEVAAQQKASPPDFSLNQVGWVTTGEITGVPGRPPTYRIADLTNPNLKPWEKEHMKKDNDEVLAGKIAFTARSSCMPAGVPGFMAYGGPTPLYFVQTPKEVLMIFSGDHQVRRVYMDVPHSESPKPSWYGESVGHYEGDTLVIDTIGQNTKTVVDPYRTPHTEKLHVVERWTMTEGGKGLEVTFMVDDPDTFYQP